MRLVLCLVVLLTASAGAQTGLDRIQRQRAQQMLSSIKDEVRKNYFDPAYRGIDLEQHFGAAHAKLEQAMSLGHAFGIIAQALLDFDDSHTTFWPPRQTTRVEYGWEMKMIGDDCYVVAVRPGSDAERKGLRAGTQILGIEGHRLTRSTLWKIEYLFYSLNRRPGLKLAVRDPGEAPRDVEVLAKVVQAKRVLDLTEFGSGDFEDLIREAEQDARLSRHRTARIGSIAVWKMPNFTHEPDQIDDVAADILKGADSLILDMRDNPGGFVKTFERFTGRFFDRDVKVADLKGRKTMKPIVAKKHGRPFSGRVVALVDSRSASAAELLARVFQLEKRAIVVGDRSSGSVMQSYRYAGKMGTERLILFGASITNADLIMSDAKSLEKVGVIPDEAIVPSAEDLAAGRDPVLTRAAAILGAEIDPKAAGALFPYEWR